MPTLSPQELERYGRHLVLPGVGPEGQERLKAARILVVGAGGLGSPAALYLAAAGVGTLGLVEFDTVDVSNLQRQVLYGTSDVGGAKAAAAGRRLRDLNPAVTVRLHEVRLARDTAMEIIRGYDLVVDGSDNFATRYLVNDACVLAGIPFVYGSVFRFEGQVSLFAARGGPCYRCLFPAPPAPGTAPDCAEGGVLGVLPGVVGSLQAGEALKWVLGIGQSLRGRLLMIDALAVTVREIAVHRNSACPACGDRPTIRELIDYDAFCGAAAKEKENPMSVPQITPKELKHRLDAGDNVLVLDVREPHEQKIATIGGTLIPMGEIPARVHELDPAREIVVYCRSGARSAQVVAFLQDSGFERVWNLKGGIRAWSDEVDPTVRKY
jgi:adenylyltransferase/sulfurtransferase